jgi:sec-independent protein translocase protein TatC
MTTNELVKREEKGSNEPEGEDERGPENDVAMSFFDHLGELRRCLVRASLGVTVGFVISFVFVGDLLKFLKMPLNEAWRAAELPGSPNLQVLEIQGALMTDVRIGMTAGIFLAGPVIFYQIWRFVSPGLYRSEKRFVVPFVFFSVLMFFVGGWFAYKLVLPFALQWLLSYTESGFLKTFLTERELNPAGQLMYQLELSQYVKGTTRILLAFATVFELPLLVAALAKMEVISHRTLLRHWRVATLLIFVMAAFLTPPEPVTQLMMAIPMVFLFFTSVAVAYILNPSGRADSEESSAVARVDRGGGEHDLDEEDQ